jgi:hypothetical protein
MMGCSPGGEGLEVCEHWGKSTAAACSADGASGAGINHQCILSLFNGPEPAQLCQVCQVCTASTAAGAGCQL